MSHGLTSRQIIALALVGLVLTFQNCAPQPDQETNSKSSYLLKLPFAYQERVDTISYMSCSDIKDEVDRRAYYSFRVGSYNNVTGGLAMTPEFREATKYYTSPNRSVAFAYSELNANTRLTLSIRSRSNMQMIWSPGQIRVGHEIESFLPPLDSGDVAGPLAGATDGRMLNYFPGSGDKRLMEASLRYYEFENVAVKTRNQLEGSGDPTYLVVGYSHNIDEQDGRLRKPPGETLPQRAYGTAYGLSFSLPKGFTSGERRVLSPNGALQEIDLKTGQPRAANWDCSDGYQFMIIRPQDKRNNLVICNATVDTYADASQQAALNALRRVLPVEDWYVDMNNRCILPKNSINDQCYGDIGTRTVQYGVANCANTGTTYCPHFVSVCIRR